MRYDTRPLAVITLLSSGIILAVAFAFQHLGGVAPCVLCVYQRWAWLVVVLAAALALLMGNRPLLPVALLWLASLSLLIGAGVAAFHVGVEQHWWAGTSECGGATSGAKTVEELKRELMATPVVRCDEVQWSFVGVSMAGWNLILSLGCSLLLLWRLTARGRRAA
jgi:disulfide bond formation protein DsbB